MAKSKSAKRKRKALADNPHKIPKLASTITPPPDPNSSVEPKSLQTLVSDEELETTIDTLALLSEYPTIIKSKACKELRVAVWNFRQACTTGVNSAQETNLTGRITAAITDGKYTDARIGLAEMRIRGERPKLGALCRWVRDLDVVSGLSERGQGAGQVIRERSSRDKELLVVLDAILRVAGQVDVVVDGCLFPPGPIALQGVWDVLDGIPSGYELYKNVADGTISRFSTGNSESQFKVIQTTPGPLRKPPNLYPAVLHASDPQAIRLDDEDLCETKIHHHPQVPNLSLIRNVLSGKECCRIVAAAESVGFLPDAPILEQGDDDSSVLAHNFYWLVDTETCNELWNRVRPYVPENVGGKKVRGLNRRFRVYRYVPGAEYRCHIDGAWPPSGIDPITKAYIYDSSPPEARQSSLLTFLIYLNDEFEGGETTFFMPSAREGVMNAYPVKPVLGGVAMFPHGETAGALLHEGTGVRKGAKYVIRTDVLYDVDVTIQGNLTVAIIEEP